MVYELLRTCFVPNDSTSGFDLFSRHVGTLLEGHVKSLVLRFLSMSQLLALEK
jgi:hypothetical protein